MKNIILYIPKIEDLWFREMCMSDENTMKYNAGYEVNYKGYHYDTGCIDFFKEDHEEWYNKKMTNPNFYYAYIKDMDIDEFVGYVNFNIGMDNRASMGIVIYSKFRRQGYMRKAMNLLIEEARKKGVKVLVDTVPKSRDNALKVFLELGFEIVDIYKGKKFDYVEEICVIEKVL